MSNIYQILYLQNLRKQKILEIFKNNNNNVNKISLNSNNIPQSITQKKNITPILVLLSS
jgi:hypothetical protein